MRVNRGYLPNDAIGKRVRVQLADGSTNRDVDPTAPAGWAADGRGGCRWSRTGSPFDIDRYEVLG